VRVEVLEGEKTAWTRLESGWRQLERRSPTASVFSTFDWQEAWWRAFAAPGDRLRFYAAFDGAELIGLAPMMLSAPELPEPARARLPPRAHPLLERAAPRRLCTLFNHYSGRSDWLFAPERPDAAGALAEAIVEDRAAWDVCELRQVPEDSPTLRALLDRPATALRMHAVRTIASPYLDTLGGTYDAWYAARFSGRKRQQDRRRQRQAEKLGGCRLEVLGDPRATVAAFEVGMEVEARSWKGASESSIKQDPRTQAFMRQVVARFAARGEVAYTVLELGGQQAAFLLGFVFGGTFYFHKTGYDPAFQEVSPGRLVLLRSLEETFARGLARFDFLGAPDDYKLQCAPEVRPHATAFLYHPGLRSRAARALKRRVVPLARRLRGEPPGFEVLVDR
jgi:CelD/BcsL family acetyltransferase involved in cellulose biosynthesis